MTVCWIFSFCWVLLHIWWHKFLRTKCITFCSQELIYPYIVLSRLNHFVLLVVCICSLTFHFDYISLLLIFFSVYILFDKLSSLLVTLLRFNLSSIFVLYIVFANLWKTHTLIKSCLWFFATMENLSKFTMIFLFFVIFVWKWLISWICSWRLLWRQMSLVTAWIISLCLISPTHSWNSFILLKLIYCFHFHISLNLHIFDNGLLSYI